MTLKGKAHPKAGVKVLDAAGKYVEVHLDGAIPLNELHMIDDAGRLVKVVDLDNLGGDGGAEEKSDARRKSRR